MPPAAAETGESNTALILRMTRHIFLANLLGLPAASVPLGLGVDSRLPVGLQLVGAWWEEATVLRLACALEGTPGGTRTVRPPTFFDELDALLGR